jgi:hypothetical protein
VFMRDALALGLALRCTRNAFGSPQQPIMGIVASH